MFLIEVKGRKEIMHNTLEDDFLQFMPNYFECEPHELKVTFFEPAQAKRFHRYLSQQGKEFFIGVTNQDEIHLGEIQEVELPPELNVGDPDPSDPEPDAGKKKKVKADDPRTKPKKEKSVRIDHRLAGKKVTNPWPYRKEKKVRENGEEVEVLVFEGHKLEGQV